MLNLRDTLVNGFTELTHLEPRVHEDYDEALNHLSTYLEQQPLRTHDEHEKHFLAAINRKFRINRAALAAIYAYAASKGIVFNYLQKQTLQLAIDQQNLPLFLDAVESNISDSIVLERLCELFVPATRAETLDLLRQEVAKPTQLRIPLGSRDVPNQLCLAALSSYIYSSASEQVMHQYFSQEFDSVPYRASFSEYLRDLFPTLWSRDCSLMVSLRRVGMQSATLPYTRIRNQLLGVVEHAYTCINNYGYFAIVLEAESKKYDRTCWQLAEELKLYAEKFKHAERTPGYFSPNKIAATTLNYNPQLDVSECQFELANEGFVYRDCIVLAPDAETHSEGISLLLLFQKNIRDETLIPCPACRTRNVRGNSYPSLGVKSWECQNLLCPDRSKYNRGKRYSFRAILMQDAISDPANHISRVLINQWSRDVQPKCTNEQVLEMLVKFYSLDADTVKLDGFARTGNGTLFGRNLKQCELPKVDGSDRWNRFRTGPWFKRYRCDPSLRPRISPSAPYATRKNYTQYLGDSRDLLTSFDAETFDAIITSPPYYNTKDYSNWPNIYCYLSDMAQIIAESLRVLKENAYVLFNIFDTFDNERTIALSAMGQKKIILSSMLTEVFLSSGYELAGNIVWDKGYIEGKRAYNGGNASPYYQSPLNCWEHILIFQKPGSSNGSISQDVLHLPSVLQAQPVVKMVRGQNVHGHTAPFPRQIPLLAQQLCRKESKILDPFSGSGTVAHTLSPIGYDVVCVEQLRRYCDLAIRSFDRHSASGTQLNLELIHT